MTTTPTRQTPPLERPRDDRVIAGVASGLARRFSIGVGWVRVGFVFLSFFGGLGFLLYIVGWLAIREEGQSTSIVENWLGDLEGSTAWIGVGLIVLAGIVFLGATDLVRIELVLAAGLFLAGVLLYRGRLGPGQPDAATPVPPTSASASSVPAGGAAARADDASPSVPQPPAAGSSGESGEQPPVVVSDGRSISAPPSPEPASPRPARPPSYLGRIVLAVGLVVIGAIALLDSLDVLDPGARHYVAAGVLVVGLGLVVGSFVGRARGLIAVGLLLMPVLFVTAAVRVPFGGEWGERRFEPTASVQIPAEYELSGGQLELDLRRLEGVEVARPIRADLGIGEMVVWLPAGTDILLTADVGIGALEIFGVETGGFGVEDEINITNGDGVTDLIVDLEVGIGALQVREER